MSLVLAVRMTGCLKTLAAAGCTSIWTIIASGSLTCSVIVAGMVSEFLRIESVHRPTTKSPPSDAVSENTRVWGVPPSAGGAGSSGTTTATAPAPGPAEGPTEGATGLREQLVRKIAMVVRMIAGRGELNRIGCLAVSGCRVV